MVEDRFAIADKGKRSLGAVAAKGSIVNRRETPRCVQ
jgi:hypothetical protein